jgi:response regulator RpfG family c-di-GMP phosphodiesterase
MGQGGHHTAPLGIRILDRLRDEGRITALQYESFYHHAKRTGERIEEILLQSGAIGETELLKLLATVYQTRYVSTERLSKADIDPALLQRVPRRVAERLQCVPIVYDARTQTLSVVACAVDEDIAKQIQVLTGAREVRVLVARPAAVRAAIRRYYGGDLEAFAAIPTAPGSVLGALDVFRRSSEAGSGTGSIELAFEGAGPSGGTAARPWWLPTAPASERLSSTAGLQVETLSIERSRPTETLSIEVPRPTETLSIERSRPMETPSIEVPRPSTPDWESYLETVKVFATLLDASRGELRTHSSHVARLVRHVADRLQLSEEEKHPLLLAAHLHDVGKASTYHLTALNVSRFEGHRLQAERSYLAPVRMFESAKLPAATIDALTHLYERWDGQGFPDRLAGKDIPLGARILALVETYADLTANPKNPYRKTLSPLQALDVLGQLGSQLFDPALVDVLRYAVVDIERASRGPSGAQSRVLVVDPDRDEMTMLELRFAEAGYLLVAARDRAEAETALAQHRFALVLCEVELGRESGFDLLAAMRANHQTKDVPFVFLARRSDREAVARGLELGAADYLVKPVSAELVVAKSIKLLERAQARSAGLSGNLRDVSLPDVVQALANGRKSGLLRITSAGQRGEIHFVEGAIVNASFPPREAEDAVYALLALKEGEFAFDPSFRAPVRRIQDSTQTLLLEAMRRIDENIL